MFPVTAYLNHTSERYHDLRDVVLHLLQLPRLLLHGDGHFDEPARTQRTVRESELPATILPRF